MAYETNTAITMSGVVRERLIAAGRFDGARSMRGDIATLSVFLRGFLPPPIHATMANCVAEIGWEEFARLVFDGEDELSAHESLYQDHVGAASDARAENT